MVSLIPWISVRMHPQTIPSMVHLLLAHTHIRSVMVWEAHLLGHEVFRHIKDSPHMANLLCICRGLHPICKGSPPCTACPHTTWRRTKTCIHPWEAPGPSPELALRGCSRKEGSRGAALMTLEGGRDEPPAFHPLSSSSVFRLLDSLSLSLSRVSCNKTSPCLKL